MGRVIAIDLGTTYCCVAIPEERSGEGFFVSRECPGVSVILDSYKNRITPSVVAEDRSGKIITGYPAKGYAGLTPGPIMFAKRFMGADVTFPLGRHGSLRPEEAAANLLRDLKEMAEWRLGETVDEAVITVPAYFRLGAKQMTEKAGALAGLRVARIIQEPVAAALTYCARDPRDPLRIMTYDLGGGTFDVAILEKRDGTISNDGVRAFGGDQHLGGYDFDKALALRIVDQLGAKGYDLDATDQATFAKLLVYAERAKITLSRDRQHQFSEYTTGIMDRQGNEVCLDLTIARDDFEEMIRAQVEYTIELCHQTIAKAVPPITSDQIDEIVMVGGSSRIPLVAQRLEAEFGKRPKLIEPDLCVALGAAIVAGGLVGRTYGCLKLDPIPTETDLIALTVTGRLAPGNDLAQLGGCAVVLRAADGSYAASRSTGEDGGFVFDEVPLAREDTTNFVISVKSPDGVVVTTHEFSVAQSQHLQTINPPLSNVLAKPVGILLSDGLHVVAPERTPLPYQTLVRAKSNDCSGVIRVPIVEEDTPLGEIVMPNVPKTLSIGSAIEITLTIEENYQIRGRAYVPALSQDAVVVIDIPTPPEKSMQELREEFELLAAKADDAIRSAGRGARFGSARAKRIEERIAMCKEMLNPANRVPEPLKIQDCLHEIEGLVREMSSGWRPDPPRAVFLEKLDEAEEVLARAITNRPAIEKDGYDKQLQALRTEGEEAYKKQNAAAWQDCYAKILNLCDKLQNLQPTEDDRRRPPQDPAKLLVSLGRELADLEEKVQKEGRYADFQKDFLELSEALKRIDPQAPNAMSQIVDWYHTKYLDLRKRLNAPVGDIGIPAPASEGGKW